MTVIYPMHIFIKNTEFSNRPAMVMLLIPPWLADNTLFGNMAMYF